MKTNVQKTHCQFHLIYNQRLLSIDMKTKDVQHVPRINISNLTLTYVTFEHRHENKKLFCMSQGSTNTVTVTNTNTQTQLVPSFCQKHLIFFTVNLLYNVSKYCKYCKISKILYVQLNTVHVATLSE